jgi:hypothetical protein
MTKQNNVARDTTIAEIHKIREKISDSFGGNIRAISEDARKRQQHSGRTTISLAKDAQEAGKRKRD